MSTDFLDRLRPVQAQQIEPIDIEVNVEAAEVRILWNDNHRSVYPFAYLRKACPCAECNEERQKAQSQQGGLRLLGGRTLTVQELQLVDLFPVGQYALGCRWNDGHSSGIYSFDLLRSLCPCADCQQQ